MFTLWLLRRLVPRTVRCRALEAIPPQRRLWAVRRLVGLGHRPRRAGRPLGRNGDVAWVNDDHLHRLVRATVTVSTSPAEVRRANLTAVTRALATAGIRYLRIPSPRALHTSVAVLDSDRDRVTDVLLRSPTLEGAYLRRWNGGGQAQLRNELLREGLRTAEVIEVFRPVTDPTGRIVLGTSCRCNIEFWTVEDDMLVAPRANPITQVVPRKAELVRVN